MLITSFDKSTPGETVPERPPVPVAVTEVRGAGSANAESAALNEARLAKEKTANISAHRRRRRSPIRGSDFETSVTSNFPFTQNWRQKSRHNGDLIDTFSI
jgi:hypothetical protein